MASDAQVVKRRKTDLDIFIEPEFLVVFDMSSEVRGSERVKIYRKIRAIRKAAEEQGRYIEWVQKSVLLCMSRDDALALASVFPASRTKVRIFVVTGEITW